MITKFARLEFELFKNLLNHKLQKITNNSQISSSKSQTNPPAAQGTSGQVSNSKFQTGSTRSAGACAA